jgi:hypothetical protein
MHFEDLTPNHYGRLRPPGTPLSVGWLAAGHAFPIAPPAPALVSVLRSLVANPVNLYRGFHECEFCPSPPPENRNGLLFSASPQEIIGNGEIHVPGREGITFVAPVLIRHYVEVHHYAPPIDFVHACLAIAERLMPNTSLERTREG